MATGKITKETVEALALPDEGKRAYLWDSKLSGFGVMVTDKGVRSYIVQYRIGGRGNPTRRVKIDRHGKVTADKARKRAEEILSEVRSNIDPFDAAKTKAAETLARRKQEKAAKVVAARLGFSTFADQFIDRHAKIIQPRTWKDTESIVRRDLKPFFGEMPLPSITSADIVELLDKVHERGDAAAVKAYKALRSLFGYAIDKEKRHMLAAASPMIGIKPPAKMAKRDRSLTDAELRLVWIAAGDLGWPFGSIIRLLILTGQRRDEIAEMRWTEIDKKSAKWLLPAERSKNGVANLVPLSSAAMAMIKALPVMTTRIVNDHPVSINTQKLVFTTTGETPVSGFSKVKLRLDRLVLELMRKAAVRTGAKPEDLAAISVAPWTIHDLRRTFASGCQRLGIKLEVTEAVLNHVSGSRSGIVGVYQVYRYEDEKRAALEAWANHVVAVGAKSRASRGGAKL